MSRWKALPAELDPRVRQLVVRLRRLKDHAGLSMRQLAARTGYSEKSWERYLGGRTLPPREAVTELARACGEHPTRLLALHEVAAEAWRTARENPPPPPPPHTPDSAPGRRALHIALLAGSVTLVLAFCAAVLLAVRLTGTDTDEVSPAKASAPASLSPPASPSPPTYTCRLQRTGGHWYAGNSRTQDAVLVDGLAGPEVAEAQCLLRRAGFSPGVIDGIFGPRTEAAVRQLQARAALVVDGIIGPHTWEALRR